MSNLPVLPYCYFIGWSKYNKFYYGVKYSASRTIAHPTTFWSQYFTSSIRVSNFRDQYGDPDIIQIRKTFDPKDHGSVKAAQKAAVIHEHKVIRRMNMVYDEQYLNCGNGGLGTLSASINGPKARKLDNAGSYFTKEGKISMVSKLKASSNFITNNPMQDSWGTLNHLNAMAIGLGYKSYSAYVDKIITVFSDVGTVKGASDITGHSQFAIRHLLFEIKGKAWVNNIRKEGIKKAAQKANNSRPTREGKGSMNYNSYMWEATAPNGATYLIFGIFQKFKKEFKILKNTKWILSKLDKCRNFVITEQFNNHIQYK